MRRALITGAGGFIGHHLASALVAQGQHVIGIDRKHPEFEPSAASEFVIHDLRESNDELRARFQDIDDVYALAADMGGMGFISRHDATIMRNNVLINVNTLEAARLAGVKRFLYTSSACIYPEHIQDRTDVPPLSEAMAYPAAPQDGYGWEKLYTERLCESYRDDFDLDVRIVRLHNVYGPLGTWEGGREKAPAAMCRKVAEAVAEGRNSIEIWGDGEQTRSFCDIRDCVVGLQRIMESDWRQPINLGSEEMVTINQLADLVMEAAGTRLEKVHTEGPQGVRGRSSDNALARELLGWEPTTPLRDGIRETYAWIHSRVRARATS
jgi:nucleoside-diphosphate-sugar epimerase